MSEYFEIAINGRYKITESPYYVEGIGIPYQEKTSIDEQRVFTEFRNVIEESVDKIFKDKSFCSDNSFLHRFLYASKFDIDRAIALLKNYLNYKYTNAYALKNINIFDEAIKLALRDGNPGVLEQRDRRGRKVIIFTASNWDVNTYSLEDIYRALLLTFDKLLEDVQNQMLGFVIIVDWTNFTLNQSLHVTPKILKFMIKGLQDCMPIKFKGIHFIAQPYYVDFALNMIKPFINGKTKKRLFVHGTNLSTLHNMVSKDILPPELGGESPHNYLDWYNYLVHSSQMCELPNTYRIIKTANYFKIPQSIESVKTV